MCATIGLLLGAGQCLSEQEISRALSCEERSRGFYCLNSSMYAWCYGVERPDVHSCPAELECRCGKSPVVPCGWRRGLIFGCRKSPGSVMGLPGNETGAQARSGARTKRFVSYFDNWSQYHTRFACDCAAE